MMNRTAFVLLFGTALALSAVLAAPQGGQQPNPYAGITIVKQEEHNNIGVDGYKYSYQQSDGHQKEETAVLENAGTEDEAIEVSGFYTYVAPDGRTIRVDYTAGKDGFKPVISYA